MQFFGSDVMPNIVNKSPWLFEFTPSLMSMKGGKRMRKKTKMNRRNKSVKNKTRKRMPRKL